MKLGPWLVSALALRTLSACYSPTVASGAPCDTTTNNCPSSETCKATSGTAGTCELPSHGSGGSGDVVDAAPGSFCLGAKLAGNVCLATAPTNAVTLSASIVTDSVAAGNCTEIHEQGTQKYCLVTGDTITIQTGMTVHAIGPNPLVLMAAHTISVQGTIDVSSHVNEPFGNLAAVTGAGGRKGTECAAVGADGAQGTGSNGSGGGAGGSFGTLGAAGGAGRNNTAAGKPVAAAAPTTLIGGCPGGAGGNGALNMDMNFGGGPGGLGGGVVYLLAGSTITVSGTINASGGGGLAGLAGGSSSGGGGGGGAGGLIGIESPSNTISGMVFANGGGGGGGGGANDQDFSKDSGTDGTTPTALATAATGGPGAAPGPGGDGGAGAGSAAAKVGANAGGGGNGPYAGGGGGGGGLGIIKVYGTAATTGAMFSPPMTSN